MKNLKKFLAVLIVIAVMATMMLPAFAEDTISADAQICKDLGILKGSAGVDSAYLAKPTQRLQAAILTLRLLGKESYALEFDSDENFEDADTVSWEAGRNVMAYLKERPDLGWTGGTDGTFAPYGIATPAHIYKVILELLGYRQGVDFAWSGVMVFAELKGLVKLKDVKELTNDFMATALVEGLKTKTAAGNETLAEKLVRTGIITEANAIKVGLLAMKVVSATPSTATQITVKFNKPVLNETTPTAAAANYLLNYNVDGTTPASAVVQADGVSVLLTFAASIAGTNKTLTVKQVATAASAADKSAVFTTTYTFADTVAPKYVSTAYPSYGKADITFSEPMAAYGIMTATQGGVDKVVTGTWNAAMTVLTLDISACADTTPISVVFVGATDKAGLFIAPNPTTVSLVKAKTETVAPTVVSATVNSNKNITIVFSEKLNGMPTATAGSTVTTPSAVTFSTADYITFTGTLETPYLGIGKINVSAYADVNGNAGAAYASGFQTFAQDDVKPTLASTEVQVISNVPYLVFKYNENVVTNAAASITGVTKVMNSITYSVTSITLPAPVPYLNGTTTDLKAVMVDISGLDVASYAGTIGQDLVKDLAGNTSATAAVSFAKGAVAAAADTTAPVVSTTTPPAFSADNSTMTVVFSEAMDAATALAVANYKINGVAMFSTAIFVENAYTVKLTATPGTVSFNGTYAISISGAKDAAGNVMTAYAPAAGMAVKENVKPVIASAVLASATTVTVTFSENVKLTVNAFTYSTDGTTYNPVATNDEITVAAKTATVTIPTVDLTKTLTLKLTGTATDANGNVAVKDVVVTIAK